MTRDDGAEPEGAGRRVLRSVLTWTCVVLSAALVWTWLRPAGQAARFASPSPSSGTERAAEPTPAATSPGASSAVAPPAGSPARGAGSGGVRTEGAGEPRSGAASGAEDTRRRARDVDGAGPAGRPQDAPGGAPDGQSPGSPGAVAPGTGQDGAMTTPAGPAGTGTRGSSFPIPGTASQGTPEAAKPSAADQEAALTVTRVASGPTNPVPTNPGTAPPPTTKPGGPEAGKPDDHGSEPDEPTGDEPGSDRTPPALTALRFDPAVVEGGAATTITIEARDDMSGLKSVRGEVRSPNRSAVLGFGGSIIAPGGLATGTITLPREAETGTWYVSWISLTDNADNTSLIQAASASAAPPGGTFSVFSSQSDATPPEVIQVSFQRPVVNGGENNVIEVDARDDSSGVASIMGACQSPSKSALIWFTGALNPASGMWEGQVAVPKTADCGNWTLQQLAVKDKAGNTTLLKDNTPLIASAGFQVTVGTDCDFTPPSLDGFDLTPTVVPSETASNILVTARVSDVGSGVAAVSGWFEGPAPPGGQTPKTYFACSSDPNNPGVWTGTITVPQFAAKGTWKIGTMRLEDKARNSRVFSVSDPVLAGRVFEVR